MVDVCPHSLPPAADVEFTAEVHELLLAQPLNPIRRLVVETLPLREKDKEYVTSQRKP